MAISVCSKCRPEIAPAKASPASSFYDIVPTDSCVNTTLQHIRAADFIAFDDAFFDVVGPEARVERIQSFPPDLQKVHEAPIYIAGTNELLYSDPSISGAIWAINIDTHTVSPHAPLIVVFCLTHL